MKKLIALMIAFSLSQVSVATAADLVLTNSESHTVVGDEFYGKLLMAGDSTLTIPLGTSITMTDTGNVRSKNDAGTIILDGGDYTVNHRQDMGLANGATLLANSGTFSVLDWDFNPLDPGGAVGMVLPDFIPVSEFAISQIIIDDAEIYIEPTLGINVDRLAKITFVAGGTGFLDLEEIRGNGTDPNFWLEQSVIFPGFGLFAPEDETITIETLGNGHTRVTSQRVLSPSGSVFTWGELLADGSWDNAAGWKENASPTSNIPGIDLSTNLADEVEVLGGTVRVDTADRGASSIDVKSGGTAVVSSGNSLRIINDVTIESGGEVQVNGGGTLSMEAFSVGTGLNVAAGGTLTIHDGTVSVAKNTDVQGTVAFTGTGVGSPAGGDFDGDGDVDGQDFLLWQRGGSPNPLSADDLAEWETNVGKSGSPLSKLIMDHGALATVELSSSGVIVTPSASVGVSVGQLTMGATSHLVKQEAGTLFLDQSGGANSLAAGSELSIQQGTLVAMNDGANNALDSGTISLEGGNLVLTSTQAGTAPFDSPLQVNQDGTILAAQQGTGALADQTITLGGTHGIATSSGAIGTLQTDNGYSINLAGNVTGPGRLDFGDGATVQVQGAVAPAGVGYNGDVSNVSVSGSVAPTTAYFFNPTVANLEMTIGFPIAGALDVVIGDLDQADGSVGFTGTLSHTGVTRLQRGALRLGGSDNTPTASHIEFEALDLNRAAVVESSEAVYNPTIGTAAGNVHWTGAGGFASRQGGAGTTVTVNGGATLDWDSDTGGFKGQALQLGSNTADAPLILTNNLNLGSAAERVIQIASNPNTTADVVRLTGVIASSGSSGDLLRINKKSGNGFQSGLVELLGNNTFANTLRIDSGAVFAIEGSGLPTNVNLQFSGNDRSFETVLLTQGTFTRTIGTAAGQVSWALNVDGVDDAQGGGFAARGGPLAVTLAGGTVQWNDPAGFNGQDLHLGSQYADDVVTFNNDLDGQGTFHNIAIFDNPDSANDSVVINSDVSNANGLGFPGNGRVVFNGNINGNTGELSTGSGNVVVVFNGDQLGSTSSNAKVQAAGESMLFLNGTVDVGDDVQFENNVGGPSIGGSGQINMFGGGEGTFDLESDAHLRPGADVNAVGTLSVNLGANNVVPSASDFEVRSTSTYHMEFAEESGSVVHDSVALTNPFGSGFFFSYLALEKNGDTGWNLELSALESLSGLISPTDEFDLYTLGTDVLLLDFDTEVFSKLTAPILSGTGEITTATILPSADFDISAAKVMYQANSGGARVYVTGLTYTGPSVASNAGAVPEPTTALLSLLGIISLAAHRGRNNNQRVSLPKLQIRNV